MKNASKYMLFMIIAIAAVPVTIAQVYSRDYRHGGLFGGGGIAGLGVGASRSGDYYSSEPGLLSRTGNVISDVAEDVADVASDVVDGPNYRYGRGYRRGYGRGYRGYDRGYGRYGRSNRWWN